MHNATIFLYVSGEGWKEFKSTDKAELEKRGIWISDGARIGDNASIGDGARIGDNARIGDGAKPRCLFITGSEHPLSYWGEDTIQIGCKKKSIVDWQASYEVVGGREGYSAEALTEYKGYIDMIAAFHAIHASPEITSLTAPTEPKMTAA